MRIRARLAALPFGARAIALPAAAAALIAPWLLRFYGWYWSVALRLVVLRDVHAAAIGGVWVGALHDFSSGLFGAIDMKAAGNLVGSALGAGVVAGLTSLYTNPVAPWQTHAAAAGLTMLGYGVGHLRNNAAIAKKDNGAK